MPARPEESMEVHRYMTRDVQAVEPSDTVVEAARLMAERDVGALPVVERGRAVGIITDRDIAVRGVARGRAQADTRVDEIMTPDPVSVSELETVEAAIELMERERIRRVVVTGDGYVKGIISLADLARHAGERCAGEVLEKLAAPREALP